MAILVMGLFASSGVHAGLGMGGNNILVYDKGERIKNNRIIFWQIDAEIWGCEMGSCWAISDASYKKSRFYDVEEGYLSRNEWRRRQLMSSEICKGFAEREDELKVAEEAWAKRDRDRENKARQWYGESLPRLQVYLLTSLFRDIWDELSGQRAKFFADRGLTFYRNVNKCKVYYGYYENEGYRKYLQSLVKNKSYIEMDLEEFASSGKTIGVDVASKSAWLLDHEVK